MRRLLRLVARLLVWLFTRTHASGLENLPSKDGALVVSNHLGDADLVLGIAVSPRPTEVLAKAELYDHPLAGPLLRAYGAIWVHRGRPDRRALRTAIQGLTQGRLIAIAPEGRESVIGGLEEGTHGAAYLALKAGVPVVPVTVTGTENDRIYPNMKRLKRTPVTITIGPPVQLQPAKNWRAAIDQGTERIMQLLADQLPPEYQGVYRGKDC
jgi:1-acyl-sn-glycerol-3-phosphate acyltransferase